MKPTVVLTHRVHDSVLAMLSQHCRVVANQSPDTLDRAEVIARCRDADALMAFMPDFVDAQFLQAAPRLKVVGAALKGYDNFDLRAFDEAGVWLSFVPDLLTIPTAELAIGLTIGLARHVRAADAHVRSGSFRGWQPQFYGKGIAGSIVGILGMGAIGKAVAERLGGWGAQLHYADHQGLDRERESRLDVSRVSIEQLLARSDIVILALALSSETLHVINDGSLKGVKPGALLINPCRGSIVDEDAVLAALESGSLGGYAADVFEMEDWARTDRPRQISPSLLAHPATLFSAHIGSAVSEVREAIEMRAAQNILAVLQGRVPLDPANSPGSASRITC
ncbi:phosphonate dehydrogenase [Halopseudomonas xinjiangensis]|uniref:Phosphonate dehydrogenase n=1 Tax=Halopseudomonas xinjiangensis TaxID=487184 RepID=A0A1H1SHJ5_9GAMM|nr:phosphonate dehydrogenase [Halopseudomonas xinjiangensis]SDS47447.1 phosphonate dehydrogenase [Halopseudomonas xinjiangensis]